MEAVNALRQAIAAKAPIALEKGAAGEPVLVIAGARYPGTLDTGIAKPTGQRRPYKLLPLYLVWLHEKSPYTVLLRALTVAGVPVTESVPANDKAAIVNYLEGREELPAGRLLEGADGRAGASGAAAAAAAAGLLAIDEATAPLTLADVVKEEIPYRSRASVLSLPGKVRFRDAVCICLPLLPSTLPRTPLPAPSFLTHTPRPPPPPRHPSSSSAEHQGHGVQVLASRRRRDARRKG